MPWTTLDMAEKLVKEKAELAYFRKAYKKSKKHKETVDAILYRITQRSDSDPCAESLQLKKRSEQMRDAIEKTMFTLRNKMMRRAMKIAILSKGIRLIEGIYAIQNEQGGGY